MIFDNDIEEKIKHMQMILDNMMMKMKLVVNLPVLLKKNKLKSIINANEMHILKKLHYYYKSNVKETEQDILDLNNYEMIYDLSDIIETLINKPKVHQLIDKYQINDESSSEFIAAIDLYKKFVEQEMKMKPKEKTERDVKLKNALVTLKDIELELDSLKQQLEERNAYHKDFIEKLTDEISSYELEQDKIKKECSEKILQIVSSSEAEMEFVSKNFEMHKFKLEEQIKTVENQSKISEEENERKEQELHKLRFDAEQKHLDAVKLYDQEIGKKEKLKQNLQSELKNLMDVFANLRGDFLIQEMQYLELKEEKELILLKIFTERLENFERNRAARTIQRTWKAHKERMLLRKKRKSKKK